MARLPLSYSFRSMLTRKLTTGLSMLGVALVVFVFAAVLMLANGLRQTLVASGDERNALIIRKGADSEMMSGVTRDLASMIMTLPLIATGNDGKPMTSSEVVVIINKRKVGTNDMGNVTVRGVSPGAFQLRPVVHMTGGRMYQQGSREIIVGKAIEREFEGVNIGEQMKIGGDIWTVVGTFEANGTGIESEIWGDVEQLLAAFGRLGAYSSVTVRLNDAKSFADFQKAMDSDQRFQQLSASREPDYYAKQSEVMSTFISVLGIVVTVIFSIGAVIGAMITMYAAVANRTVEIGTLRALGFRRRSVLTAFLVESILLSLVGGVFGVFIAAFLQFFTFSTTNFGTFSELAFGFALSPGIAASAIAFSIVMGLVGGFLPAVRAGRLSIIAALRSS